MIGVFFAEKAKILIYISVNTHFYTALFCIYNYTIIYVPRNISNICYAFVS